MNGIFFLTKKTEWQQLNVKKSYNIDGFNNKP